MIMKEELVNILTMVDEDVGDQNDIDDMEDD